MNEMVYIILLNGQILKGYKTLERAEMELEQLEESIPRDEWGFTHRPYFYTIKETEIED